MYERPLAGRVSLSTLLPLAMAELRDAGGLSRSLDELLVSGLYPRIHDRGLDPSDWLAGHVVH